MKRATKISAFLLALIMMLGIIPVSALAADANAKTSVTDSTGWTKISTAAEFLAMSATGNYYLANDIDFTGVDISAHPNYLVADFSGTLDGRGHSIYGYTLTNSGAQTEIGTFATLCGQYVGNAVTSIANSTVIMNLNIGRPDAEIQMTIAPTSSAGTYAGGLAARNRSEKVIAPVYNDEGKLQSPAYAANTILSNVNVYVNASNTEGTSPLKFGGLFGDSYSVQATNCSTNGSFTSTTEEANRYFGGFVGVPEGTKNIRGDIVYTGCVNNMSISGVGAAVVGGLFGRINQQMVVYNCTNNGALTAEDASIGGLFGNRSGNTFGVMFISCNSNGTLTKTGGTGGAGELNGSDSDVSVTSGYTSGKFVYLSGCKRNGTPSTQNTPADGTVVKEIKTADDLLKIDEDDAATVSQRIYRLANDIDMDKKAITGHVIDLDFCGIFDGNGYSVTNFSFEGSKDKQAGFFKSIGLTDANASLTNQKAYVFDLTLGEANAHITMNNKMVAESADGAFGILAARAGRYDINTYNSAEWAYICGVDVYSDMNVVGGSSIHNSNFGGMAGDSGKVLYSDCNSYGSIKVNKSKSGGNWLMVGGFNGRVNNGKCVYINSNNFASVENGVTGGTEVRVGGFIGAHGQNPVFIQCNNYGAITSSSNITSETNYAGGFVGQHYGGSEGAFYDCNNLGKITVTATTGSKGSFLAYYSSSSNSISFIGCTNFDLSTKTLCKVSGSRPVNNENCVNSALITTVDKAAVRLVGDQAGLRFRAQVSDLAMQKLEQADIDVIYGMLIGPTSMVGSSAYSREKGEDNFTDVSAAAGEWFKGEKGNIAASAIGIPEAGYATDMTAVAYIDIKVQGTTVATLYSKDVCVRSMKTVAKAALEDVVYYNREQWTDSIGEPILNQGDYTYATGVENNYGTQYSCYSPTERALLNKYAGN